MEKLSEEIEKSKGKGEDAKEDQAKFDKIAKLVKSDDAENAK